MECWKQGCTTLFQGCLPSICVCITGLYQRKIYLHSTTKAVRCSFFQLISHCPCPIVYRLDHSIWPDRPHHFANHLSSLSCSFNCIVIGSFASLAAIHLRHSFVCYHAYTSGSSRISLLLLTTVTQSKSSIVLTTSNDRFYSPGCDSRDGV